MVPEALAPGQPLDGAPVVCIVASAGGLHALEVVLGGLTTTLDAGIVVLQHLAHDHPSALVDILSRATSLPVRQAEAGSRLEAGRVLVAPPDHHLVVGPADTLWLTSDAPRHFVRPSADVLLESAANELGSRTIAIVLTGSGVDGADGVRAVAAAGGQVVVEDPDAAEYSGMPEAALATGVEASVVPLADIAASLAGLVAARHGEVAS